MFSGTSIHSIDSKGRIILPARFREQLGDSFIIAKGFFDCVQVLSVEEFEKLRGNIKKLPAQKALMLQYALISTAVETSPNSQGRIQSPQSLRERAELNKDAMVGGMDNRVEIWDKDKFEKMLAENQSAVSEALELLSL